MMVWEERTHGAQMAKVIGIDLGTTNGLVAQMGSPQLVPDISGRWIVTAGPSTGAGLGTIEKYQS
jgi:molecular chaperone DnaK (HSP70)